MVFTGGQGKQTGVPHAGTTTTNTNPAPAATAPNGGGGGNATTPATKTGSSSTKTVPLWVQPAFDKRIRTLTKPFGTFNGNISVSSPATSPAGPGPNTNTIQRGAMFWDTINKDNWPDGYAKSGLPAVVNFLFNPSTISASYQTYDGAAQAALMFPTSAYSAAPRVPIQQQVSFSIMFDRTYELNDASQSADMKAFGVWLDVAAMMQLTGMFANNYSQYNPSGSGSSAVPTASTGSSNKKTTTSGSSNTTTQFGGTQPNDGGATHNPATPATPVTVTTQNGSGKATTTTQTGAGAVSSYQQNPQGLTPPQLAAKFIAQGIMQITMVVVQFGSPGTGLCYYGFIDSWDVQYTHFNQGMVPMRCVIDISFTLLPVYQGQVSPTSATTIASTQLINGATGGAYTPSPTNVNPGGPSQGVAGR